MNPLAALNASERRALFRGGALLLLAAVIRVGWELRPPVPLFPDGEQVLETLVPQVEVEVARAIRRRTPLAPGERLDPNTAPPEELARLPGVGPALADRIVAFRESEGPFLQVEALERVPGIGEATLARLAPFLALEPGGPSGLGGGGGGRVRVNPDRASAAELERLPGIGPVLAERMLAHRETVGRFRTPEDLLAVSGIGPALLERLRPHLVFTP
jgi:competence ComEA-like helix-hairpin-helix protein